MRYINQFDSSQISTCYLLVIFQTSNESITATFLQKKPSKEVLLINEHVGKENTKIIVR